MQAPNFLLNLFQDLLKTTQNIVQNNPHFPIRAIDQGNQDQNIVLGASPKW
jgi:hypothetical protein